MGILLNLKVLISNGIFSRVFLSFQPNLFHSIGILYFFNFKPNIFWSFMYLQVFFESLDREILYVKKVYQPLKLDAFLLAPDILEKRPFAV